MVILLTGCTGFLGSHLLKALAGLPGTKICALKRSSSNLHRVKGLLSHPQIAFIDIDEVDLSEVFRQHKIDLILHTATEYDRTNTHAVKTLETNLLFPLRLLEQAVAHHVKTFINTDSYFNKDNKIYSHLFNYSLSKKNLHEWLKLFSSKIKICNMMLEHIYGEHDNTDKFVEIMVQKIAIKQIDSIDLTSGSQKRDFIYVDDVVSAFLRVIEFSKTHQFTYKNFEVGIGSSISIKEFVMTVKEISKSKTVLNFDVLPQRADEIVESAADNASLKQIGWAPQFTLNQGIQKILLRS